MGWAAECTHLVSTTHFSKAAAAAVLVEEDDSLGQEEAYPSAAAAAEVDVVDLRWGHGEAMVSCLLEQFLLVRGSTLLGLLVLDHLRVDPGLLRGAVILIGTM